MIRLWRECRQVGRIPEPSEIDEALCGTASELKTTHGVYAKRSGISRLIELDRSDSTIRVLAPGVEIDLGAIGKGYAIDQICETLRPVAEPPGAGLQRAGHSLVSRTSFCTAGSRVCEPMVRIMGMRGGPWGCGYRCSPIAIMRHSCCRTVPSRPVVRTCNSFGIRASAMGTSGSADRVAGRGDAVGHRHRSHSHRS